MGFDPLPPFPESHILPPNHRDNCSKQLQYFYRFLFLKHQKKEKKIVKLRLNEAENTHDQQFLGELKGVTKTSGK